MTKSATTTTEAPALRPAAQARNIRWVLRRATLGLVLLTALTLAGVLLLDASIDGAADAGVAAASE